MADVYIKLSELETVMTQLGNIVTEFENATTSSETLEDDISDPFGKDELREKAEDFEERWDDKRNELKDSLSDIKDHVKGVLDGFRDWDSETAVAFEAKEKK